MTFKFHESYGHDPYTYKRSRSHGSKVRVEWIEITALPPAMPSVIMRKDKTRKTISLGRNSAVKSVVEGRLVEFRELERF